MQKSRLWQIAEHMAVEALRLAPDTAAFEAAMRHVFPDATKAELHAAGQLVLGTIYQVQTERLYGEAVA